MLAELLNTLIIEPKIPLTSQIVTAADSGFFLPLQLLVSSILQSHEARLTVIDLGLTPEQLAWLKQYNVEVMPMPDLIYPQGDPNWQQWNKPAYIKQFEGKLLWIDADCLVTGSLEWLTVANNYRLTCATCSAAEMFVGKQGVDGCLRNLPELYARYPVPRRIDDLPNNGVIALDTERDKPILDAWLYLCTEAANDQSLRPLIRFWDQGAFQWALEKTNNIHVLIGDKRWNDGQSIFGPCNLETFTARVKQTDSHVLHFAGNKKPYYGFGLDSLKIDLKTRTDLKLFVLDHNRQPNDTLTPIAPQQHIQHVNLDELQDDPELAESRLFLSDVLDNCETEFIGLCSGAWNIKYTHCRHVEDLHKLKLDKGVVWAGCLAQDDWVDESERQHPGMKQIVLDLVEACGAKQLYRQSVWNNNFICHRSVMLEFLQFWRECHAFVLSRYGSAFPFDNFKYDYNDLKRFGRTRRLAYVCERFALLYFANRTDLRVKQIPL